MKRLLHSHSSRPAPRSLPLPTRAAAIVFLGGAACAAGCLNRPIEPIEPNTSSTVFERLNQGSVTAIDLLLAIDNSASMADKQEILALAVPHLVLGLVNPRCLNADGSPAAKQPAGPLDDCPAEGSRREFKPITDIHIGIISSSLGGHGGDSCADKDVDTCLNGSINTSKNDKGHLLSRTDPCGGAASPTYNGKGFLAWDPKQKLAPPGEGDIEVDANDDGRALIPDLKEMVKGVGQRGCGYESQLESWYRFLVDPEPYKTISVENGKAKLDKIDDELLAQRRDFLRPDSLVAIILLTDENDCSIQESGQGFLASTQHITNGVPDPKGAAFHLPRPRAECAVNPDDPCCKSCGQVQGACPPDPTCVNDKGELLYLTAAEDPVGLRCFDQKRRFGFDFLYPIDRYTKALTASTVPNRAGELVPNPLFSDLDPTDARTNTRLPDRVFFAGIVGVPWQDIARDKSDLSKGLKTADELDEELPSGHSTWDILLGDLAAKTPPQDPHMIESIEPRIGENPITNTEMVAPGEPLTDPINGSERAIASRGDLQYACTFPLPTPRDCNDQTLASCDCRDESNKPVLCEDTAGHPGDKMLQVRAKAYPGTRELRLLRDLGSQGIVASVCPAQMDTPERGDFGYRPAIGAIVDQLKTRISGQCLPRKFALDEKNAAPCLILEARRVDEAEVAACNQCNEGGRSPATDHPAMINAAKGDVVFSAAQWNCFCMIDQVKGADRTACQNDTSLFPVNPETHESVSGWCYVDATTTPPTGAPELVSSCGPTEKRMVRFVGDASEQPGATLFIHCDTSAAD